MHNHLGLRLGGEWGGLQPSFFQDEPTCTMCNEVPPQCELQLLVSSEDGMWYDFTALDAPEGVLIEWYIDDFLAQTGGATFQAGFDFNPNWSVCAQYVSEACGELVQACYSNLEGVAPCTDLAGWTSAFVSWRLVWPRSTAHANTSAVAAPMPEG